ncbi:hypothetical protein E8E15_006028 [Penicillium rubens]|jgi:hypothetical protein|uniref:Uncharacterized protein n=1 Tax=Penicillium chrysogenum TaxID=5076 RepID=A0A167Q9G0_PENCH|nr:uncharacterized protein N7525_002338 [Penicillium rubens]KZN84488.1 hypothetical protein EN45_086260 [Penicillium chrysogenum]KAF3020809.1 hypothetical protein E8E15_006028 [Penicillium rubens]KAJ5033774.1 hypothetical protein NUH16_005190 [Penicillium rubens]KAJ5844597.1 hypothetical protein N7525_002338 [Penicillium rubens]KAJ5844808.1 hypothetical protein N7534_008477 [Penicillium rubens]
MSPVPVFGPGLQADYTNIVQIVETQIETLTYKARRRHEVIGNLETLCRDLVFQARCDERKPRSHLLGYAQFQRFSMTLRLCLPEAILVLGGDWTSYQINNRTFDWMREDDIEYSAACILKEALLAAQSSEWYL